MDFKPEVVPIADCKPYQSGDGKNYRKHPPAQVEELAKSLEAFGQYKNIVISSDGFILAGEGVWRAAQARGDTNIAAIRMPFDADDPNAAKLLVADNELSRLADDDETQLADLLKGLQETVGLEGTGYDDGTLQELLDGLQVDDAEWPDLPDGDRAPFQQMTFTLADEQAETVKEAMSAARDMGPFIETGNENGNGNALARVCEGFLSGVELGQG